MHCRYLLHSRLPAILPSRSLRRLLTSFCRETPRLSVLVLDLDLDLDLDQNLNATGTEDDLLNVTLAVGCATTRTSQRCLRKAQGARGCPSVDTRQAEA